ncbi:3672_t:CDS:1, partial [Dentiscutata erythropus]
MKNLKIVGVQKQNLHSTKDYLDALEMITSIESLQQYFKNYIIPIIADWPGQYFIRKILTHYYQKVSPIGTRNFTLLTVPENI